jgi:hypothetical protein
MARKNPTDIHTINQEPFIVGNGSAVVVYNANSQRTIQATGTVVISDKGENMIEWGYNNTLPDEREDLIANNNIVPQLLATKRNIILGQGLKAYRENYVNGEKQIERVEMPQEIEEWLEDNEIESVYLPLAVKNLLIHGNVFTEFIPFREYWKIKIIESRFVRAQKQNAKGQIPNYFLYGSWKLLREDQKTEHEPQTIRSFSMENFELKRKCLMQCADRLLGGPYYFAPHWEGAATWIKVANCIPEFHHHNLRNGYTPRFLIKIPNDYFVRSLPEHVRRLESTDVKEFAKAEFALRQKFVDKMNKFFAGTENAGRAMITTKFKEQFGSSTSYSEIELQEIDANIQDEAMLKLFESSNSANTSSHGTPPALAGIATGAKMTSGSEIRNLYNFYQLTAAPQPRNIILKPIKTALKEQLKKYNIKLGFIDVQLATTDTNRTGTVETQIAE